MLSTPMLSDAHAVDAHLLTPMLDRRKRPPGAASQLAA